MCEKNFSIETRIIHGDKRVKHPLGSLTMPIFQTSAFVFDSAEQGGRRFAGEEEGFIYSRLGSPTVQAVQSRVALLEDAESALAFASGMGAISSATSTFMKKGSRLVAEKALYGCAFTLFSHKFIEMGVDVEFVDFADGVALKKALENKTDMVYFETISNPIMKVLDIAKIAGMAHDANQECIVVVDNTFATGLLCKPLNLGADIVVHSATKYLNGHGDVIAGFACGSEKLMKTVFQIGLKDLTGSVLGPQDAFLVARGLKTLALRMERHCSNARKVAEALEADSRVKKVHYPGLASNEYKVIADKQFTDAGGMISFELESFDVAKTMLNNVKVCTLAVSLGDTATLIEHPASMTHSTQTPEELKESGISDSLVRLSVGLENSDDIIWDLMQALDAATK